MYVIHSKQWHKTIGSNFVIFSDGTFVNYPGLIHDGWEDFDASSMSAHFNTAYETFMNRLKELRNLKRALNSKEEKELKFMLEALIAAKNISQEM